MIRPFKEVERQIKVNFVFFVVTKHRKFDRIEILFPELEELKRLARNAVVHGEIVTIKKD